MTYAQALNFAIDTLQDEAVIERLTTLRDTLAKRSGHGSSDEAKAKANAKRREETANARLQPVNEVSPILRKYLKQDTTAKDLFEKAKDELPSDFSAAKVQNVLIREMAPELIKTENKRGANTYRLA